MVTVHLASELIGHLESGNGCNGTMMAEKPRH